jgi:hypothetical protein
MSMIRLTLGALLAALVFNAAAAPTYHVPVARNFTAAYVLDWRAAGRATAVTPEGRGEGRWADVGAQRVLTLSPPIQSAEFDIFDEDCPDVVSRARNDTLQIGVTLASGTLSRGESDVVLVGNVVTTQGCNAGRSVPFGALTDPGLRTRQVSAGLRPSTSDLVPGVSLAGPSELPGDPTQAAADVMTFVAGGGQFAATGQVHPLVWTDGWFVIAAPWGERGYTRVAVDRMTGAETWIEAAWSAGQPTQVFQKLMVKPAAGAGFGSVRQASKVWESGLFAGTNNPFFFRLYRDGSGERVAQDLALGTETRTPISWAFDGVDIVHTRALGGGTGHRRWVPLRNASGLRFVMESETQTLPDGTVLPFIAARVNFYLDQGPATPPPAR